MSYWFIIGTTPPVRVFMCIHVNTRVLPACCHKFWMSLTQVVLGQNWYGFTGTCLHVKNSCFHCKHGSRHKFFHRIRWIEPIVLVNSHTEHVKSQVVVCWEGTARVYEVAIHPDTAIQQNNYRIMSTFICKAGSLIDSHFYMIDLIVQQKNYHRLSTIAPWPCHMQPSVDNLLIN